MPNYVNVPYCDFFYLCDRDDLAEPLYKWNVYVTGHSLGGALATLLALELSSSQLAK
jgi:pimeloyl-ACP methyl ester carboxylesterase